MQLISHKLPPAAYFYYEATGHMSQIGRAIEVVKTGQEIAAKFEKRHLQPQTSLFDMPCAATMSTRLCDFIKASGCCHWDAEWDWWKEEEREKLVLKATKTKWRWYICDMPIWPKKWKHGHKWQRLLFSTLISVLRDAYVWVLTISVKPIIEQKFKKWF